MFAVVAGPDSPLGVWELTLVSTLGAAAGVPVAVTGLFGRGWVSLTHDSVRVSKRRREISLRWNGFGSETLHPCDRNLTAASSDSIRDK